MSESMYDNTGVREKRINPKRLARLPRQLARRKKLRGELRSTQPERLRPPSGMFRQ
jgi:hypothetical protein